MSKYKTYRKERYLFFWLSIVVYFVPYVVTTACLFPLVKSEPGTKWAVGLFVVFLFSLPFVTGIFKGFRAHFPFASPVADLTLFLLVFMTTNYFQSYLYTLLWISLAAGIGRYAACALWFLHRKYKRKCQTVSDVVKSGLLNSIKGEKPNV